jgi:signal peptidase I
VWPPLLAQEQTQSASQDFIDHLARTPLSNVIIFVGICTVLRIILAPAIAKIPPFRRGTGYTALRIMNEAIDAIVYAGVFVFLIIRPFCVQAFKIPSGSMLDTLQINDYIVANKAIYRYTDPKDGDIVVFRPPVIACQPDQLDADHQVDVDFIKRCIGVPGDIIEIRSGTLYRNGKAVQEPYIREKPNEDFKLVLYNGQYWPLSMSGDKVNDNPQLTAVPFQVVNDYPKMQQLLALKPAPIPKGFYLFMGDNRNNSFDGRAWGLEPRDDIIGRSEFIWMPISRWRSTH